LLSEKYKILQVLLDGDMYNIPVINNSHVYTIWVLRHKYTEVKLYGIINVTYKDKVTYDIIINGKTTFNINNEILVNTPNINPIVDVNNTASVVIGLGVDSVLILKGTIYENLISTIAENLGILKYSMCSTYFDNHIIRLQIGSDKIHGVSPKLNGIPYYKYTSKIRKTFNRRAEIIRKLLGKTSNMQKKYPNKHTEEELTPALREYYESQLHEFVHTYIYKGKEQNGK
jgi:hypothetical protein